MVSQNSQDSRATDVKWCDPKLVVEVPEVCNRALRPEMALHRDVWRSGQSSNVSRIVVTYLLVGREP